MGEYRQAPHAAIVDEFLGLAEQAPAVPPVPTATDYLAAQGHKWPQAEKRVIEGLRVFLSEACFTPGGECDEGGALAPATSLAV